jgi:hypothetical protein
MDKTNPNLNDAAAQQAALLNAATALHQLRDSLVEVSLYLQDYQFRLDSTPRRAVADQARELIDRARSR